MRISGKHIFLLIIVAGLAAACSSAKAKPIGSTSGKTVSSTYRATLKRLYHGTDGVPPTTPAKAPPGKNVWIISCAEAAEGCAYASKETKLAGQAVGWKMTVFDGQFDANNAYDTGIRQAIAAGADGIILDGIDCNVVKAAMQEAKKAGVKTIEAQDSNNCTGTPLASAAVIPDAQTPTPNAWAEAWGQAKAEYLQARLNGHGKILDIVLDGVSHTEAIETGFHAGMASCSGCVVVQVHVTLGDLSTSAFETKMENALLRNPDVKAVVAPYDNLVQEGVDPALAHASLHDVFVLGGEGLASNIALIRGNGGQSADLAYDTGWMSWAAVDTLIRVFDGQRPVPEGFGFTAVDASHNMPASGAFVSRVDYQSAYKKDWSVK